MPNNPIPDEQLAELDRWREAAPVNKWAVGKSPRNGRVQVHNGQIQVCAVWSTFTNPAQGTAQYIAAMHNAYPALRKRLTDAEARLAEAERERDQLRAEVEDMRQQRDYWQESAVEMRRYKEAAESLLAGLRGALEEVDEVLCVTKAQDIGDAVVKAFSIINAALALTLASAGNRLKAEATRKCAAVLRDDLIAAAGEVQGKEFINAIYAASGWLEQMADGIEAEAEKEAANG